MLDAANGDVVGSAELALQPCDGQLPSNFPSLLGAGAAPIELFPYLCNVAVTPAARRRGVAQRLVEICEEVAVRHWEYECMYLHVSSGNEAAVKLYLNAGFKPAPDNDKGASPTSPLGIWLTETFLEPNLTYLHKELPVY